VNGSEKPERGAKILFRLRAEQIAISRKMSTGCYTRAVYFRNNPTERPGEDTRFRGSDEAIAGLGWGTSALWTSWFHWSTGNCTARRGRYMAGERDGHTLQASALVNEVYLRLIDVREIDWQNRAQFFGVSAQLMRRILVDFARRRHYLKRGGGARQVTFDEGLAVSKSRTRDLVAVDDALNALAAVDARKARAVEMRFFGGLSVAETAEVLKVSLDMVTRDWRMAKAWLHGEMNKEKPNDI
jgi:RNA polymerase sigma-70 factor, ECF subfamily